MYQSLHLPMNVFFIPVHPPIQSCIFDQNGSFKPVLDVWAGESRHHLHCASKQWP